MLLVYILNKFRHGMGVPLEVEVDGHYINLKTTKLVSNAGLWKALSLILTINIPVTL